MFLPAEIDFDEVPLKVEMQKFQVSTGLKKLGHAF